MENKVNKGKGASAKSVSLIKDTNQAHIAYNQKLLIVRSEDKINEEILKEKFGEDIIILREQEISASEIKDIKTINEPLDKIAAFNRTIEFSRKPMSSQEKRRLRRQTERKIKR
jgi:hypothetical protein